MSTQSDKIISQQKAFLDHYAKNGVVQRALEFAGVTRHHLREWKEDEIFEQRLADARIASIEIAEEELRRRALGYDDPVIFQGHPVYRRDPITGEVLLDDNFEPIPFTVKKRSDRLIEVYMRANDNKYKDKSTVEHTGEGGGSIKNEITVRYVLPEGKTEKDYEG